MRELLQTERAYVEDLARCIDVYVKGWEKAEAGEAGRELPTSLKWELVPDRTSLTLIQELA